MTPEHLRQMSKNQLLELLESAVTMAKHMPLVEDPRVHGAGENGPLMAIGDLEIWPRGEPGRRFEEPDRARVVALAFLNHLGEGKIMECCDCHSMDTMFQTTDIADLYEDLRENLKRAGRKQIAQQRCEMCGITNPPQVEVTGPFAWQDAAPRKYFCSMHCFGVWLIQFQDQRDEETASGLSAPDPSA